MVSYGLLFRSNLMIGSLCGNLMRPYVPPPLRILQKTLSDYLIVHETQSTPIALLQSHLEPPPPLYDILMGNLMSILM